MVEAIRKEYPELHLTISSSYSSDYLGYAAAGQATAIPIESENSSALNLKWKQFFPPARRLDGGAGGLGDLVQFGKYLYTWQGKEFILYIVQGSRTIYGIKNNYLLGPSQEATEACLLAASRYENELHEEIWVFDGGYWQKSRELWWVFSEHPIPHPESLP